MVLFSEGKFMVPRLKKCSLKGLENQLFGWWHIAEALSDK